MINIVDVRKSFSYNLPTGSIAYTRNGNFNSTTTTILPLTLNNSGSNLVLTAYISASVPWIRVIDPTNGGRDITFPTGSVTLQPSSSRVINLSVDLPPSIENVTDRDIYEYPEIYIKILSGSGMEEQPPTGGTGGGGTGGGSGDGSEIIPQQEL